MTYDRIAMLDHTIHHLNKRIKKLKRQLNQAKKVKKEVEDLKRLLEKGKQNG
jgi:prefoldin subunit 5